MCEERTVCDAKPVAQLRVVANRYELVYPDYDLIVRGPYAEWVLEAAAEIVGRTEKLRTDGALEELKILSEFEDSVEETDIEAAKYEARARFGAVPQCIVSMGANDYRWVHQSGRAPDGKDQYVERLHDQSLTRDPGDWLVDEDENQ
ncbi:MAG: hypothetical protein ACFB00_08780 [Parvularculaceae bacterium]